jgi:3-(3-hydroxy-phenyl)propionate hydroxylase
MNATYDVAVVGFGPVGATLSGLLAQRGLRVIVIDKDVDVFPLPRAAHVDHEAMRIWQELGCADELFLSMRENVGMDFLAADGTLLHCMRSPGVVQSGWPASLFFHQPALERTLRKTTIEHGVSVRLGTEVTAMVASQDGARLTLSDETTIDASWVVGCDGGRSLVRKILGIELDDLDFEEPWLVVDVVVNDDATLPDRALQICDPARPHTLVPMPSPRFRFEFMLLPGEDADAMQDGTVVRELMARWIDPTGVEIERSAVYAFHGLIAKEWRRGRVFLAGDAAHQMPPFLGQGMCSGLRDAANLAWKLDLVHRGAAGDALLDTYQREREPHVRAIVEAAVGFGRIICTTDPAVAAERDAAMSAAPATDHGMPSPHEYTPQPLIDGARLDDLVGARFAVIGREPVDPEFCDSQAAVFDAGTHPQLHAMLDQYGTDLLVIRPDRYVLAAEVSRHLNGARA